jgi:hypothetical protein
MSFKAKSQIFAIASNGSTARHPSTNGDPIAIEPMPGTEGQEQQPWEQ